MRQFPREIEADLLFRGIDVLEWFRGTMSSRRLLVLIDALPDDSAYWRERRDGDWDLDTYLKAMVINEVRLLRADQAAIHANYRMDIKMMESPAQQRTSEEAEQKHLDVRQHFFEGLRKTK